MKKKTTFALCLGAAAVVALPVFLAAPGRVSKTQKAPFLGWNFAHRGLHRADKSVPENSLEAFRLAGEAGYGAELDVQLSKDGQVVVFHDDTLDRVCSVHGRVDAFPYDQLQQMSLCGTDQHIPLFSQVLEVFGGRGPLVVELKTGPRNKELCEKTLALLEGYRGDVCIESFDPRIVAWFRRHAPQLLRGQLAAPVEEYTKDGRGKAQAFILSRCLLNFLARPQFIAYKIGPRPLIVRLSERLGALKFGWTSHGQENEAGRDGVIFEFYRPRLRFK